MSPSIEQLESELADIFRSAPDGLTNHAHLAIPKKPAMFNALTHGLTGQNIVVLAEELPRYARMALEYMRELRPVGAVEAGNVQLIFEARWRLHRIAAIENDLLLSGPLTPADPVAHARRPDVTRQVNAFREESRHFDTIIRYETRLSRNAGRYIAELQTFQKARAAKTPDLVFDEQSNPAVLWYKKLLVRSEELTKARQEYDAYQAAQKAQEAHAAEAAAAKAAERAPVPVTPAGNSFCKNPQPALPKRPGFASPNVYNPEKESDSNPGAGEQAA